MTRISCHSGGSRTKNLKFK